MAKKVVISPEQRAEEQKQYEIKQLQKRIELGSVPKNPTRLFNVGDSVKIGNLRNIVVTEVLFDGLAYCIHYDFMGESYGRPDRKVGGGVCAWTEVFPMTSFLIGEPLREIDDVIIRMYNTNLDGLLHMVYNSGVDFSPDYQRDLVWTQEQKIALIDSIFNNVDIGKFTFIKHDYSRDLYYEILDGKQRLSTLCEYYEDRFKWKGKYFSELCGSDANHYTGFSVAYGEVGEITEQQIYKLFVKMNTSGTPMSQDHLKKIKSLIKQ
jgi:hypothetical protein